MAPNGVDDCPRKVLVKFSKTATAFPAGGMKPMGMMSLFRGVGGDGLLSS